MIDLLRKLPCTLLVLFAFTAKPVVLWADVVTLRNGDRLTGEVRRLRNQRLSFETSYAGIVEINWEEVADLVTEGRFEVEAETGRKYQGSVESSEKGIEIVREDTSHTLDPLVIVEMTPLSNGDPPGFWQILEGSIDLGLSFTRGNSRLDQSSLGIQGEYRREGYKLQGNASSLFSQVDDSEPTSRQTVNGRYDLFLGPKGFAFALTGFERNDRQRLNLRSRLGGGFGWKLVKSRRTEFSVLGGFTFINEQFRDADSGAELPRSSSGEAVAGIELDALRFNDARVTTKLSLLPNLADGGRYRIEYDTTFRMPVFRNLTWSLSLFDRFDSNPPFDVQRNDYGAVSSFGFSF